MYLGSDLRYLVQFGPHRLIAVEKNPLEDISSLEHVFFVMKGGEIIKGGEVKGGEVPKSR